MTYRSLLLFALCATAVACSEDAGRAPAPKPIEEPKDAYVADLSIPEDTAVEEDATVDSEADAVVDSTVDSTIVDTTPADTASDVDGDALVDGMSDVPATCLNGSKDEGETDIDCGGMSCGKCAVGKTCAVDGDCIEKKCSTSTPKTCSAPTCTDTIVNGTETDVDCGGASCTNKCGDGKKCLFATDCTNGVCLGGVCQPANCTDGVQNGGESDVDCGGGCPKKCRIGEKCFGAGDCGSSTCALEGSVNRCLCPSGMTRINVPTAGGTYCMDQTEVSNEQYAKLFLATGPDPLAQDAICSWNMSFVPTEDWPAPESRFGNPVRGVDWCDALAFCKKQGKILCGKIGGGATPADKFDDYTVSKWHNACSQGVNLYPYSATTYDAAKCNGSGWAAANDAGAPGVYPVVVNGTLTAFDPSRFLNKNCIGGPLSDIYQLSGNVAEWEDSCTGTAGAADKCLVRGGSFMSDETALRCGAKREVERNARSADIGIRCCL